jgi:hypothetical protein
MLAAFLYKKPDIEFFIQILALLADIHSTFGPHPK